MRWIVVGGSLIVACTAGCGNAVPPPDPAGTSASEIQGGTDDPTHRFAVAIIRHIPPPAGNGSANTTTAAICSGALLAPNLVATARHCVSDLPSASIDCATSAFAAVTSPQNLLVTTDTVIGSTQPYRVARIVVPSAASQTHVCGNDIALLILTQTIDLPAYVTPAINPPMTNHVAYTTKVTAIGYGVNTPSDPNGASAGTRRIRQGIGILCIPNDPASALDCYKTDPSAPQYVAADEFISGDGTCEGDSGSSAFDQGSFNQGKWVSFGVLSRGGLSAEGGTCSSSIYSRFDSWAPLLTATAMEAAAMGGYPAPVWAGGPPPGCLTSDTACNASGDCCSNNCLSRDRGVTFVCAGCDCNNPCDTGLACKRGVCVPAEGLDAGDPSCPSVPAPSARAMAAPVKSTGCACTMPQMSAPLPWAWVAAGLGTGLLALGRRRRSVMRHLSGSRHGTRAEDQ